MRKRDLGKTGLKVSELSLGTWGLSGDGYGEIRPSEQEAVLQRALKLGITLFETADIYGGGKMEKLLAQVIPKQGDNVIITKVGTDLESSPERKRFDADFLRSSVEASLERLERDKLDLVLLHNPSETALQKGKAAETMAKLAEEGLIGLWGVSAGEKAAAIASVRLDPKPSVIQVPYNILHSAPFTSVEYTAQMHGIGLLARSVLAHGLLAGFWTQNKTFDDEDHRKDRWTADQLARRLFQAKALKALRNAKVTTQRAAALRFVLDNPRVSSAVIGPKDTVQLDQLVREAGREPPYLDAIAKRNTVRRLTDLGVYQ